MALSGRGVSAGAGQGCPRLSHQVPAFLLPGPVVAGVPALGVGGKLGHRHAQRGPHPAPVCSVASSARRPARQGAATLLLARAGHLRSQKSASPHSAPAKSTFVLWPFYKTVFSPIKHVDNFKRLHPVLSLGAAWQEQGVSPGSRATLP